MPRNLRFRMSTLVYLPGATGWVGKLVSVDRKGAATPLPLPAQAYGVLKFSPDGQRLAAIVGGASDDVWIYESARGAFTRLTTEGFNSEPVWNPDGERVTFRSIREGTSSIVQKSADGSGMEERILTNKYPLFPGSWSPDGTVLAFSQSTPTDDDDLWILPMDGDRTPRPFLQTHFAEWVRRSHPMVTGSLTPRTNQGAPKCMFVRILDRVANGRFQRKGEKNRDGHEVENCFIETPQNGCRLGCTLHPFSALKNHR